MSDEYSSQRISQSRNQYKANRKQIFETLVDYQQTTQCYIAEYRPSNPSNPA
jgi:hypothetical protein